MLTNNDATYPVAGDLMPGAGAISAGLVKSLGSLGHEAVTIGKPNQPMMDCIKEK